MSKRDCSFALKDEHLKEARICALDGGVCHNFMNPQAVSQCPTLQAYHRGEPVGKVTPVLSPEMPHVIRKGRFGYFATGMPPEYLMGRLRAKKKKSGK